MNDNFSQTRIVTWKDSSSQVPQKKYTEFQTQTQRQYFQQHFGVQVDIKVWKPKKAVPHYMNRNIASRFNTPTLKIDDKVVDLDNKIKHANTYG